MHVLNISKEDQMKNFQLKNYFKFALKLSIYQQFVHSNYFFKIRSTNSRKMTTFLLHKNKMTWKIILAYLVLLSLATFCNCTEPEFELSGTVFPNEAETGTEYQDDPEDDSEDIGELPEERKQLSIFVVDFSHVSTPFIISLWIAIAGLAKIGKLYN